MSFLKYCPKCKRDTPFVAAFKLDDPEKGDACIACGFRTKNLADEKHNEAFKEKVLKNKMLDAYDQTIIRRHLSNFYCVFQLGWDAHKESLENPKAK